MPPATWVRTALPPILPTIRSCPGPHMFFSSPTISTGMGSGSVPWSTVQAVACMPGRRSEAFIVCTFPIVGGAISAGAETERDNVATSESAAAGIFIGPASLGCGAWPGVAQTAYLHYQSEIYESNNRDGVGATR